LSKKKKIIIQKVTTKKKKIKEWRMETRGKNAHLRGLHGLLGRW
jgi:hypothetical protein